MKLTTGLDFINLLRAAFTCSDHKSAKKDIQVVSFFALLESMPEKTLRKHPGTGTYSWKDGRKHVGEFKNGLKHGKGIEYSANGKVLQHGQWTEDFFIK